MIECLSDIFGEKGLVEKLDGLNVNKKHVLNLEGDVSKELLSLYVDITARLGVEIAGLAQPLTGSSPADAISIKLCSSVKSGTSRLEIMDSGILFSASTIDDLQCGMDYIVNCYPYDGKGRTLASLLGNGKHITWLSIDSKELAIIEAGVEGVAISIKEKGNKDFCGFHGSYDRAKKHFKQNLDVRIVVDDESIKNVEATLLLALRLAMENYETVYPYAIEEIKDGYRNISFKQSKESAKIVNHGGNLKALGSGSDLKELIKKFVFLEHNPFETEEKDELEHIFSCKNEVGQAVEAIRVYGSENKEKVLVTKNYALGIVDREKLENIVTKKTGPTTINNFNDEKEIFCKKFMKSWEGEDLLEEFRKNVLPAVKPGDRVHLSAGISEDLDVRNSLVKQITNNLKKQGIEESEIEILRAYKPGYSWIEEKVIPKIIKEKQPIKSIKIEFQYLNSVYSDEQKPAYTDLPTRWLQELFPVDELISDKLDIDIDSVEFERNDDLPFTYRIKCFDENNELAFQDDFDVKHISKNYIAKYPDLGITNITCGWINAKINGETVVDKLLETDTQKVWNVLEKQIIPILEDYLVSKYGKEGMVSAQPLFNRLQININISEMDYNLGFRQERISSIEAMQEDLYFYLLDWFKIFGQRECGGDLDNVGLIMPEPEIRKGEETEVEVIFYEDYAKSAEIRENEKNIIIPEIEESVKICELSFDGEVMVITAELRNEVSLTRAAILEEIVEYGAIDFLSERTVKWRFFIKDKETYVTVTIPKKVTWVSSMDSDQKDKIIASRVIDYDQYLKLLKYYDGKENVRILPVETTYKGRKIFSIECIKRRLEIAYGENKLKSERISAVYTGRHHGNEASSVNSTFMLLDKLLSEKSSALDTLNLVLVPFINIDGGMLHCDVQKKHPNWLCHPARYNSAGFEFTLDSRNQDSMYGEAKVIGKLWRKYLFDAITDNHGFGSHELCQPFSGYIPPGLKAFWIPRALYYGYLWFNGEQSGMRNLCYKIRQKVAESINCDKEINKLNLDFAERFEKYAHKWLPDVFEMDSFRDVIFYMIDTHARPRPFNFGITNPEITAFDWTTEVADETATDEFMEVNVRAHHISDVAVIDVLLGCERKWDTSVIKDENRNKQTYIRFRRHPLYANED